MSRKIVNTPATKHVKATVIAQAQNLRLKAAIKSLADARILDEVLSLAFPHEFHHLLATEFVLELEEILGPVRIELLPMLSVGLELGGIVTEWR